MDKKLTLSLNANVVDKAKHYAKDHGISLSRMLENYLASLTSKVDVDTEIQSLSPLVSRLVGVIHEDSISEEDFKGDYTDFLNEKYR